MPTNNGGPIAGLTVGVVGGSIAGCAVAIELLRAGCDVTVFERSERKLRDRGAGIGFPASVMETLIAHDFLDPEFPYHISKTVPMVLRSENAGGRGRIFLELPIKRTLISWQLLYNNLRKRVPDALYHKNCEVTGLREMEDTVELQLRDGRSFEFDLVVFGDGYKSFGRSVLFPNHPLAYAGYIAWRGILDEGQVTQPQAFEDRTLLSFHEKGHSVMYFVPGADGASDDGNRMMSWVWYEVVAEDELPRYLTDSQGEVHAHSLPHGKASQWHHEYLHERARRMLPDYCADVICATENPFIQSIFDLELPEYHAGRICLLGDASSVVRPHTAGGTPKALTQAIALGEALQSHDVIEDALKAWSDGEKASVSRFVKLGESMGRAMVLETPNLATLNAEEIRAWWQGAMGES